MQIAKPAFLLLSTLSLFGAVSSGAWEATQSNSPSLSVNTASNNGSEKDPVLLCKVQVPNCAGRYIMISVCQSGETTDVGLIIPGEALTVAVDSSGSEPLSEKITCPETGEKIELSVAPESTWGEVNSCDDLVIQ